jgi:hypothetical protein
MFEHDSASRAPLPHAVLQHTASTQWVVVHWLSVEQDCPCAKSSLDTDPTRSLGPTFELHPTKQSTATVNATRLSRKVIPL